LVTPVCASFYNEDEILIGSFWHHKCDERAKEEFRNWIRSLAIDNEFVSFNVESEARYLIAMGFTLQELLQFKWICQYLEWRMLLNHNHRLMHGNHLDGKVTMFSGKPNYSLAGALFRLLKIKVDTDHKEEMRQLIISNPSDYTPEQKKLIMLYCESDTKHLPKLLQAYQEEWKKLIPKKERATFKDEIHLRAEYAVRTAEMVNLGHPINVEQTRNLSDNVPRILESTILDICQQFPEIKPWRRVGNELVMNQKNIRAWIAAQKFDKWELTDGGKSGKKDLSLALDAWTEYFDYRHNYPRGNFGAQMVRFLKLKQALNGFTKSKTGGGKKKTFWDYAGNDGRVRPYFGIYGAQSGRSQPAATGYIPLKPAWTRSLIQPNPGRAIASIDYSSQEFLLAALASNDKAMLDAYDSGDVYLAFAKRIRLVPPTATKATHKFERDLCKSTVLGLSYLMSKYGLAIKLTQDTGKYHSEEDAQKLIDLFDEAYPDYKNYRDEIISRYHDQGYLKLPSGWYMFGNNNNFRSIANMPIQGWGGDIMRKAVGFAQDAGLQVILTLHDALYIEYQSGDYGAIDTLAKAMDDAFRFYVPGNLKSRANCRLEAETWSPDYVKSVVKTPKGMPIAVEPLHIDERGVEEYKFFNKYFHISRASDNDLI
jgi:hypothetical protein